MRTATLMAGIAGLVLAATIPASAQRGPSVNEAGITQRMIPIGLVLDPTAYTLPVGRWMITGGAFEQAVPLGDANQHWSAGVYRTVARNLQLGGFWAGVKQSGQDMRNFGGGAAHYTFINEGQTRSWMPSLALGGWGYGGDEVGGTIYLVASKNLTSSVRPGAIFLHAGARWDAIGGSIDDNDVVPFVGANLLVTRDLSVNGEWRSSHPWERHDLWAFGAAYNLGANYVVSAGFRNVGLFNKTRIYAGLSVVP